MIFFYIALVTSIVSTTSVIAFPQDAAGPQTASTLFSVDGFVFNGTANRPTNIPFEVSTNRPTDRPEPLTDSTTTVSSTTTDRNFTLCLWACPRTPEYNPVCGSDNNTYDSPGQLSCAGNCGKPITLKYYGQCSTARIRG
ncbi:uncharacterized protein LOC143427998 [Xylocopa sonorina]|uniref:uncharacterized protein LOC143427998 n=1 Tax=Xylocopa sonorina TaxID=1818115 RepID=UPI00403A9064